MLVALCLGILLGDILIFSLNWQGIIVQHWVPLLAGLFICFKISRRISLLPIFGIGILIIGMRFGCDLAEMRAIKSLTGKTVVISGTIMEDPDTDENQTKLRIGRLKIGSQDRELSGVIFVSIAKNSRLKTSDEVKFLGKIEKGFGVFIGALYRPKIIAIFTKTPRDFFLQIRDVFSAQIRRHIPPDEVALGMGYLLGVKSSLPSGLSDTLKVVGLTHIIVASGANLSILINFARKILGKISRFTGFLGSLLLIIFYIGMTGITPSMARAGVVSGLSLLGWYTGRIPDIWRLLLLVATATLLYNPMYIIDLGWMLSFASFAGLLILAPILTSLFYGDKKPNILGATIIETISASLICTPILLYFFGSLSLISIFANLLILPTIPFAMALCFATGISSFLPVISELIGKVSTALLHYHLEVIRRLGEQTAFLVKMPKNRPEYFLLYMTPIIAFLIFKIITNRGKRLHQHTPK